MRVVILREGLAMEAFVRFSKVFIFLLLAVVVFTMDGGRKEYGDELYLFYKKEKKRNEKKRKLT